MSQISVLVGENHVEYERIWKKLSDNQHLKQMHWNDVSKRFNDFGNHSEKLALEKIFDRDSMKNKLVRVVNELPVDQFVDHFGYVSLFPFLLKLLEPGSAELIQILEDLPNPALLWTDFGLRSLATTSSMFLKYNTEFDAPYWRGPIWINMNYLTISSLDYYRKLPGSHQAKATEIYQALRNNVVNNIFNEFKRTNYLWEQYDGINGKGKGCHPFTGWTSLVILMMAEIYPV